MAAHADADDRNLDDVGIRLQAMEAKRLATALQHLDGTVEVGARDGEGQIGGFAVRRDVLHDHIDIDRMVGERAKDCRRHAGAIGDSLHRNLGFVAAVGDAADDSLFHDLVLVDHERTGHVGKAR